MAVLELHVSEHVAVVTLNRPEARNALNPELVVRLAECWQSLRDDAGVRAVVLTGAGGSTFCSGFDLAQMIPLLTGARTPADEWDRAIAADDALVAAACLRGGDLGKPLVVAANGHAIAAGMELLRAGDLRVAASGAKLGLAEVKVGLIPAMGGTATLSRHVPRAVAAELLLTGDPISAERALEIGFINRVVDRGEVLPNAIEIARTIAGNAPLAVTAARELLRASDDLSEAEALAREAAASARLMRSEDAVEGPRAFLERRRPQFVGR